jgi:predicted RNase H-like HicB family nuclease
MEPQTIISFGREFDGRWIAEAVDLPGVLVYGFTGEEARRRVEEMAQRIID